MEGYLRTNPEEDTVLAFEVLLEYLTRVRHDPRYWTWVIFALHKSLQGLMVLALQGNIVNVLSDRNAEQWLKARESGNSLPTPYLAPFMKLYDRIQSDRMERYISSKAFVPAGTQTRSVKKLNEMRDDFVHFKWGAWSIPTSGLPRIVEDCLAVISFLVFKSGNIFWNNDALGNKV